MSQFADHIKATLDPAILATFGDDLAYAPASGAPFMLRAVIDRGADVKANSLAYLTVQAPLSNFPAEPVKGDTAVWEGIKYRVADIERLDFDQRLLKLVVAKP
jgi:hypothetical protein